MAQVVERLPSQHKAMNSNPNTVGKKMSLPLYVSLKLSMRLKCSENTPGIIFTCPVPKQKGIQRPLQVPPKRGSCLCPSALSQRLSQSSQHRPTLSTMYRLSCTWHSFGSHQPSPTASETSRSPWGQEGVWKSIWFLVTPAEHQDDLSYLSKKQLLCMAQHKDSTVDFSLLASILDPPEFFWSVVWGR
jgi:hypothetical protein